MTLTLYNTLRRAKDAFVPQDPARVTLYVCGPTVYDYAHIGNARSAVAFDVLYRVLAALYPTVVYARNITDVDDKINKKFLETGEPIEKITTFFRDAYVRDMDALNVLRPTIEPFATHHIAEMIQMIGVLLDKGHAYEAQGHVLFHTKSFKSYGQLGRVADDEIMAGARVEVAPYKKDPQDFVLWKPSTPDLPGWDSPWGRGRPGWHIECSAMAGKHLGTTIDIHGGGLDLIFPHHDNEIAQSQCCNGAPLARYWLHNGYLTVDGEKMSKSLGNFVTVHDLLDKGVRGEAIRYALISGHYRQPLDWSQRTLDEATTVLDRFYTALERVDHVVVEKTTLPPEARDALFDDLNTPAALAVVHHLVGELNKATETQEQAALKSDLLGCAHLLGILQNTPAHWFQGRADNAHEIESLIADRNAARARKDFAAADKIRQTLADLNIVLEDTAIGTKWKRGS